MKVSTIEHLSLKGTACNHSSYATHLYAIPERIHTLPFLAAFSAGISLLLCLILLLPCGYHRRNAKHRFQCINILCGMVREPHNSPVWKCWPKPGSAITKSCDFCPSVKARRANHGLRLNQLHHTCYTLCPRTLWSLQIFFTLIHLAEMNACPLHPCFCRNLHVGKNKLSIQNENKISFQIAQICLKMLICLIFMMRLRLNVPIWRQQGKPCPSI